MKLSKLKIGQGLSFSLEIYDEDNRRLDRWRNMLKDLPQVISIINDKYSIKTEKKDDLSWLK